MQRILISGLGSRNSKEYPLDKSDAYRKSQGKVCTLEKGGVMIQHLVLNLLCQQLRYQPQQRKGSSCVGCESCSTQFSDTAGHKKPARKHSTELKEEKGHVFLPFRVCELS